MKKIYTVEKLVKVGKDKPTSMTMWTPTYYTTEEEAKRNSEPVVIPTFEKLVEAIEKNFVIGDVYRYNFFGERIHVRINADCGMASYWVKKKAFRPIEVQYRYIEVNPTMKQLQSELTADEFCEYLRDRGISKI